MSKEFHDGSLSFRYPDNWDLEREDNDHGWMISVQSPGTGFLTACLDTDFPDAEAMTEAVLDAMKEEYPQLEADPVTEEVAGQWAVGHDMYFISLDLTNTCRTRCFDTPEGTLLLMWQSADFEMQTHEPVFAAVLASLQVDDEE